MELGYISTLSWIFYVDAKWLNKKNQYIDDCIPGLRWQVSVYLASSLLRNSEHLPKEGNTSIFPFRNPRLVWVSLLTNFQKCGSELKWTCEIHKATASTETLKWLIESQIFYTYVQLQSTAWWTRVYSLLLQKSLEKIEYQEDWLQGNYHTIDITNRGLTDQAQSFTSVRQMYLQKLTWNSMWALHRINYHGCHWWALFQRLKEP
jgi:hypothetical protein